MRVGEKRPAEEDPVEVEPKKRKTDDTPPEPNDAILMTIVNHPNCYIARYVIPFETVGRVAWDAILRVDMMMLDASDAAEEPWFNHFMMMISSGRDVFTKWTVDDVKQAIAAGIRLDPDNNRSNTASYISKNCIRVFDTKLPWGYRFVENVVVQWE